MLYKHYHFIGVAGVGMSGVAQAAVSCGCVVSGSDRYYDRGDDLPVLRRLSRAGIALYPQDGSGVQEGADAVVVSSAIEASNPDLNAAVSAGIPVLHRSELLAELVKGKQCLAVAGTSGKSTVAGMVGWILQQSGMDPNVVNGAPVINWQSETCIGNFRGGQSDLWVIEADESDRSLLNYSPDFAVVTNMSADHFSLDDTVELFNDFAALVRGRVVGALDGAPYLAGIEPEMGADSCSFEYAGVVFELSLPGMHNVEDAMHAVKLCEVVGVAVESSAAALREFRGIHRRLELAGTQHGIAVIDDYGHNPAKIAAAWRAVVPFARRGIVIWRPHGYGPLRAMLAELTATFAELWSPGDIIAVLPVYDAGGTARRDIRSEVLVEELRKRGVVCHSVSTYDNCVDLVRAEAEMGDVVVVMGARDPHLPDLARRIVDELGA